MFCVISRAGKKVEYRFYNQLEQIFGPVLIDEPDEKDEEAEKDPGLAYQHTHNQVIFY